MRKKLSFVFGLGFALYQLPAQALELGSLTSLPQRIQGCLDEGDCAIAGQSAFDVQGIAAFSYQEDTFSGYLFRYTLTPPSAATDLSEAININPPTGGIAPAPEITPLAGSVWLQVAQRYVDGTGGVVLYLDHVTPLEKSVIQRIGSAVDYPSVLNFQLTSDAFTNAAAFKSLALNATGGIEAGDLSAGEPVVPCLAEGCSTFQQLNLLGMRFVADDDDLLLQFAADDPRGKLYTETMAYSGNLGAEYHSRDYYISSVPLPGAWLLGLTGFGFILARSRGLVRG